MEIRLNLEDWSERDERRFQRRKYRMMKMRLQQAEFDETYDTNSYSNPSLLRSNSSSNTSLCSKQEDILNLCEKH